MQSLWKSYVVLSVLFMHVGSRQRVITSSCYFNTNDFDSADNTFRRVNIIRGKQTLAVAVGLCLIFTLYHKYKIQEIQ